MFIKPKIMFTSRGNNFYAKKVGKYINQDRSTLIAATALVRKLVSVQYCLTVMPIRISSSYYIYYGKD